ncbi:dUTP diphosphatase [Methylorubrum suomiense]|uniref:dUTP diphosphatase n=1 Tax=Methylorubrum suomiense TaxID=144191 RepID=A0ABQ4UNR1_9HYPH|nr:MULTISPECIES: dUTP diphosphatase [Methylobacteriaceae]GJE73968.1 Deoxyuridine 5'-triphosphate nucleotidohydrolase [Methylorubrum suomiense]
MKVGLRILDSRLQGWGFPRWGSPGSAGLDLHACLDAPLLLAPQATAVLIPAGFSVRIGDSEWCGLVHPRSGRGHRDGLVLGNGTGVIDADYEGPLLISAWNRNPAGDPIRIEPGERIAQIVFTRIVRPDFELIEDLVDGERDEDASGRRGQGGFGSTGLR